MAVLARRFGVARLELCEDAAQTALLRALEVWPRGGIPDAPAGWLRRVAINHVLDAMRRECAAAAAIEREHCDATQPPEAVFLESEVRDDVLRMLFVCADPAVPHEGRLVLALKTLCGFSTEEIALRLLSTEEAVHKRLQRARAVLRERGPELDAPPLADVAARLSTVHETLYLLFNEGYGSAHADRPIRRELSEEAIRLGRVLSEHPIGAVPETHALLALMHLHVARFDARLDDAGGLLLLDEQDRTRWDQALLLTGLEHLERSAGGFSTYHLEASIAAEHCLAPSFAATNWERIVRLYQTLERIAPSPLYTLNRAIALVQWRGVDAGLEVLEALRPPAWLLVYYLWDATLGELYRRRGDRERAVEHLSRAADAAPTRAERALIERRLALV